MGIGLRRLRLVLATTTALILALSLLLVMPRAADATVDEGHHGTTTTTTDSGEECPPDGDDGHSYQRGGGKGGDHDNCETTTTQPEECPPGGEPGHGFGKGGDRGDPDCEVTTTTKPEECPPDGDYGHDGGDDGECGETTTTTIDGTTTSTEDTTTTSIIGAGSITTTTAPGLEFPRLEAVCDEAIPVLAYVVDFPNAQNVTITFINPTGGEDVVYEDVPLSGSVLWPGASRDPQDWPGWVFEDGVWTFTDDGFMWARGTVDVRFEVNPTAVLQVPYPEESPECADPENIVGGITVTTAPGEEGDDEVDDTVIAGTLPFTGADDGLLVGLGTSAIALGALLLFALRRNEET